MIKEACIESFEEAVSAEKRGANRIELCANLDIGGTTPSEENIIRCSEELKIPVFAMIRPRGGNFVYSEEEIETMKAEIGQCREIGIAGIVLGILTPNGQIDIKQTRQLVELAKPMQVTFHKAFDEAPDYRQALEDVIATGAHRILTSGTKETAAQGADILNKLIEQAQSRIIIVAAGKVTRENLGELSSQIKTDEFHGRKIV